MHWILFPVSALAVIAGGILVARSGDRLADSLGLTRLWVGSILVAAATSMPELVVDVTAVRIDAADLAVGDLFGSSMANMLILAVLDLAFHRRKLLQSAALEHVLTATLAISLTAAAALSVLAAPGITLGPIGPATPIIAVAYLLGARVIHRRPVTTTEHPSPVRRAGSEIRRPIGLFLAGALVILAAGPVLAISANDIAADTGVDRTFVGVAALAMVTSLPELSVSITAVRMGATDLAVGNLFGSNAFNMLILLPLDLSASGSLLDSVSEANVIAATAAILMMSLAMMSLVLRAERRFALVMPDAALVVAVYCLGLALVAAAAGK